MSRRAILTTLCLLAALPAVPVFAWQELPDIHDVTQVADAARRGDFQRVHFLCEEGAPLDEPDGAGFLALQWAAFHGDWPLLDYLLGRGAPINGVGGDGGTCLHGVAHYDRPDVMARLLDAGGDLAAANNWARQPLHVAARRGCLKTVKLLLDHGADLQAATHEGWTPLHVAYRSGQPEMVELLLARGADTEARNVEGNRPSESRYDRPAEIETEIDTDHAALAEYTGLYDLDGGFSFEVRLQDDDLVLTDVGPNRLYRTGRDRFHCRGEPWRVEFKRDDNGAITTLLVDFLRRQVQGTRREHPQYVGSDVCLECHLQGGEGDPGVTWLSSRHGLAYWRLATDWATVLAHFRPHYRDVVHPEQDSRCLLCHISGAQVPDAIHAPGFRPEEGVGCESCHGPGSLYVEPEVMTDREAFLAAGGRIPDTTTCSQCHRRANAFDFETWWPKVAHRLPPPADKEH